MKRLLLVPIVLAAAACSPSMPAPPEQHYIVTDTVGNDVVDIAVKDEKHRSIAWLEDTTMHVINGNRFSSGMWDYNDESGKNVIDTKPISVIEFKVRGLSAKDPNDKSWYALWWVRIGANQIEIANNDHYDHPALIQPDKVFDADGTFLGSVAGMDIKDATGKVVYHVKSGPLCACYGVMLLEYIPPMRRAAILQRLLDTPK